MFAHLANPQPKPQTANAISPRTRLLGGFVMDCDTAIAWASRMFGETITKDEIGLVWELIEERVQEFGNRFSFVGPVLYEEFMIVTRKLTFYSGYLGMDPKDIPRFHEAEKEKKVRELLKDEGLGTLVFATRLD